MDRGSSGARATTRRGSERSWRMRVLVTREELVSRVESLGHEPVDARAYDWLVVTSRNGAHELARRGVTANRIAAIGPATAEALRSHELPVDAPDADVALLMSGSAARALAATGARVPVVAIGPQTAAEARVAGLDVVAVAATHDVDGLVEALRSSTWSSPS